MYVVSYCNYFYPHVDRWWYVSESEDEARGKIDQKVKSASMLSTSDFSIRKLSRKEKRLFLQTCQRVKELIEERQWSNEIMWRLEREGLLFLAWRTAMNYLVDKGELSEEFHTANVPA